MRVPCTNATCKDGLEPVINIEGRRSWDVCHRCLGCRTIPADHWSVPALGRALTERKAA